MAKLNKMYYYKSTGEKKLNCYYITIPKELVEKAKLSDEVELKVEGNKIIVKEKKKKEVE